MQERIRALEEALRSILIDYDSGDWGYVESCNAARTLLSTANPIPTNPEKKEN